MFPDGPVLLHCLYLMILLNFGVVIRKYIFSLNNTIHKTATSNSLLAAFLNSDLLL